MMNESEEKEKHSPEDRENRQSGSKPSWKLLLGAALIFGALMFLLGYFGRSTSSGPVGEEQRVEKSGEKSDKNILYWTCSMHPQVHMSEPGKCPICYMDLIPVYDSSRGGDSGAPTLALSEAARELAQIETSPVESRPLTKTVRMVGKIDYDETRLADVSAWVGGRIDKLHVNYVGDRVNKGDPLTYLYSPELRVAQEEYIIADRRWKEAQASGDQSEIDSAQDVRNAIKKKLELWGILRAQIEKIGSNGGPDDHMTIYAPASGTVIERDAFEGKYVEPGERLFSIVNLSDVWANLDAYEIDLAWLRVGQKVEFETDAFPGETFQGKITFIQPVLDESTRTVKVRVNVPNPGERLKPGMYARATLEVPLDEGGKALKAGARTKQMLSIPATAPLLTGSRAVVYVEDTSSEEAAYTGRQIELGPRVGDYYLVRSGLQEGERVVTRGNFKIDSALQIQAKPSMMKPEGGGAPIRHQHGDSPVAAPAHPEATLQLTSNAPAGASHEKHASSQTPLNVSQAQRRLQAVPEMKPALGGYLQMTAALAKDDAQGATAALDALRIKMNAVDPHALKGEAHERFAPIAEKIKAAIPAESPKDIEAQRNLLPVLTKLMGEYLAAFEHGFDSPLYEMFCPMAFGGKGGTWYQQGRVIENPYYGKVMLRCGEIKREIIG